MLSHFAVSQPARPRSSGAIQPPDGQPDGQLVSLFFPARSSASIFLQADSCHKKTLPIIPKVPGEPKRPVGRENWPGNGEVKARARTSEESVWKLRFSRQGMTSVMP